MHLFEFEGKQLFARYGIPVPEGGLWGTTAALPAYPLVAKAQLLTGGRGKRGGIRFVDDAMTACAAAEELLAGTGQLPPAAAVLLESRLEPRAEYYLALLMDREQRSPVLLASTEGGVDVESARDVARIRLNPLIGIPAYARRQVADRLGLVVEPALDLILDALWRLFVAEDCLLVEINPLILTTDGTLVAADAKVTVDDNARSRHPDWPAPRDGTAFERQIAALGANAAEMDGEIAVITSGAGLGMATMDTVATLGGTVRCFVDLGGTVFQAQSTLTDIVDAVRELQPRAILISYFFAFARADNLAAGIAASFARWPAACPVVVRPRGTNEDAARGLLQPFSFTLTDDMFDACQMAVEAVSGDLVSARRS